MDSGRPARSDSRSVATPTCPRRFTSFPSHGRPPPRGGDRGRMVAHPAQPRNGPRGGSAARRPISLPRGASSSPDVVKLAGVHVEAVGDLPERGHRLEAVPPRKGRQVGALAQGLHQRLVAIDQDALALGELDAHHVLHAGTLRSPAVPITIRSSCSRFAFNSNRGSVPAATFCTPKRKPSWASASDLPSSLRLRLSSALGSGISISTSISSWRSSAV